jgi:hypothetical protein
LIGGVAPYGYQVVDRDGRRVLAVNPDEAAVVREVAHGYLCEAVGFKTIAKGLRARQVASRRGAGWSFTSVRSLLMNPILTGWTRYNVHKMHLNRSTGRRVHRAKAEAQQLRRHDESLRILDDATFARIEERMDSGSRGEKPQATRGIGPFTSLVYCTCGAKCYRVKSENRKGSYTYYVCSRHQRYEDCPSPGRVREDKLVEVVNGRLGRVFEREDEILARTLELATESAKGNRDDAARLKRELAAVELEQARRGELLMDRELPAAAKAAIGRQMSEASSGARTYWRPSTGCGMTPRRTWKASRRSCAKSLPPPGEPRGRRHAGAVQSVRRAVRRDDDGAPRRHRGAKKSARGRSHGHRFGTQRRCDWVYSGERFELRPPGYELVPTRREPAASSRFTVSGS